MGIGYRATKSSKRREHRCMMEAIWVQRHTGLQLSAMQETEVSAQASQNASVFPSEGIPERSLFGVWQSWQSEAKDEPAFKFKRATPTPENLSAVGPLFYLKTPSLLPRRQYLTGSQHRTLVRFRSLRTGKLPVTWDQHRPCCTPNQIW